MTPAGEKTVKECGKINVTNHFLNAKYQTYPISCKSEVMGNKVRISHHGNSAARLMLAEISVTGYKRIGKSQI